VSSTASRRGWRGSSRAPRASTRSPAASPRSRPGPPTGSPAPSSSAPSAATSPRSGDTSTATWPRSTGTARTGARPSEVPGRRRRAAARVTTPQIKWISRDDPPEAFPDVRLALAVPNGLLAAGGDLGTERLLTAYERTIFPWYDEGQPILWWSPDPRCVLVPDEFHVSRSLRRRLRRGRFVVTCNRAFESVIRACGAPRRGQAGTWITPEMIEAFCRLHREHWAHSVEVWEDDRLVG